MILAEVTLTGTGAAQLIGLLKAQHANQMAALAFQGNTPARNNYA